MAAPTTRKRTVASHRGTTYALIQYDHDFTLAECDPDGSHERSHFLIPARKYCPKAPPGIKRAPTPIPHTMFVKYPAMAIRHEAADFSRLKQRILREVQFCELLRVFPHPNVAQYQGCVVIDGYIRGICFARYPSTLNDCVNPLPGYCKEDFRYGGEHRLPKGRKHFLTSLKAGVEHIHGLGYVHNDLKPDNVMVKEDGGAVVIDFDSVMKMGASMWGNVPRTPGWFDPRQGVAVVENDWDAVRELKEWMGDKEVKGYKLPGEKECYKIMGTPYVDFC